MIAPKLTTLESRLKKLRISPVPIDESQHIGTVPKIRDADLPPRATFAPPGPSSRYTIQTMNKALRERFGAGEWVVALEDPSVS